MVVYCLFYGVCLCATNSALTTKNEYVGYLDRNEGSRGFQINLVLALTLMKYVLSLNWGGDLNNRPSYVQAGEFSRVIAINILFVFTASRLLLFTLASSKWRYSTTSMTVARSQCGVPINVSIRE